jgi:hypothetical protein
MFEGQVSNIRHKNRKNEHASIQIAMSRPDDGGSKDLWNVGKLLPDYTVLQPRRQQSEYSPPWEPQILLRQYSLITSACCSLDPIVQQTGKLFT